MISRLCVVALSAITFASVSQAGFSVLIDSFDSPYNSQPITINQASPSQTDQSTGTMIGTFRDTSLSAPSFPDEFAEARSFISGGRLTLNNDNDVDSTLVLSYDANGSGLNQFANGTYSFEIDVVSSDIVPFDLTVSVTSQDTFTSSTITSSFQNSGGGAFSAIFLAANFIGDFDFIGGTFGTIDVTLSSTDNGSDVTLESIGFRGLPEPSSLAVVGILGLGGAVAVRRKKRQATTEG